MLHYYCIGPCEDDEFQCDNGRCIDAGFVSDIDSLDNCGDGSDEVEEGITL